MIAISFGVAQPVNLKLSWSAVCALDAYAKAQIWEMFGKNFYEKLECFRIVGVCVCALCVFPQWTVFSPSGPFFLFQGPYPTVEVKQSAENKKSRRPGAAVFIFPNLDWPLACASRCRRTERVRILANSLTRDE